MLKQYINYYNPDLYYIIEGDLLSIEDIIEISKEYDIDVVCIGTPNITREDLFNRIRNISLLNGCWTSNYSNDELYNLCDEIIEESKKEFELSKNNNFIYLDNSYENDCLKNYVKNISKKTLG